MGGRDKKKKANQLTNIKFWDRIFVFSIINRTIHFSLAPNNEAWNEVEKIELRKGETNKNSATIITRNCLYKSC